jgi:putative transferase (TIGR04331 family)
MKYIFSGNNVFSCQGSQYKLFDWIQVDTKIPSIEDEFRKNEDLNAISDNINIFYEILLNSLNYSLNKIDDRQFSVEDARIMYGPWLHHFISHNYYIYSLLSYVYKQDQEAVLICNASESFSTVDTLDHKKKIRFESYNSYIIQLISKHIGIKLIFSENKPKENQCQNYTNDKGSFARNVVSKIEGLVNFRAKIILKNSYIGKKSRIEIFIKSLGLVSTITNRPLSTGVVARDYDIRDELELDISSINNNFTLFLARTIKDEIPTAFIESFFDIKKQVKSVYKDKIPNVILSANAWYHDEPFKLWAIICRKKGTKLVGYQHGGVYFTYKNNFYVNHESSIVERYYSWGEERINMKNVKPFYSQKYRPQNNKKTCDILMVSNVYSKYHHFLEIFQTPYSVKVKDNTSFFNLLDKGLIVKYRGARVDYGWGEISKYQKAYPNMQLSNTNNDCVKEMTVSRVVVFDSVHATSLLEAIMMNIPFVILANNYKNEIQIDSINIFQKMINCNLIFENPDQCAYFLNKNVHSVSKWWSSEEVQSTTREFSSSYVKKCSNFSKEFIREMKVIN